jgi:hypothetical protein
MRRIASVLLLGLALAGCETREVENDLRVVDVHTGWYDTGIVNGENKLVPSISLRLENVSDTPIDRVQLNAVFRRVGEEEMWGSHLASGIGPEGLAPGATTEPIVLRSTLGYTSSQARLQMLQNREFVDARVEVFGKHGRRTWIKLQDLTVARQLLTE